MKMLNTACLLTPSNVYLCYSARQRNGEARYCFGPDREYGCVSVEQLTEITEQQLL